jgi:hypothetical protein
MVTRRPVSMVAAKTTPWCVLPFRGLEQISQSFRDNSGARQNIAHSLLTLKSEETMKPRWDQPNRDTLRALNTTALQCL